MSKIVQDAPRPPVVGTITQFLTTLPSPLTVSLISLSPQIRFVRWVLELVSWKGSWEESWLLLAGWWGLCLGAEAVVRYTLPLLAIASWWWLTRRASARATHPQAATEETLQQTVADLTTIQELLPQLPFSTRNNTPNSTTSHDQSPNATKSTPLYTLLRILAFTYPPYLLLTMTSLVRLRTLLAIYGTLAIIHRAPFSILIRRALWRSAYFRWTLYWTWAKISNTSRPGSIKSSQPAVSISVTSQPGAGAAEKAAEKGAEPRTPAGAIRFLFTVYENQRWWMALDWTAALLPGERPSWCSRSLQPCSPPAAFSLPPPTIVYLPAPSSASSSSQSKNAKDAKGSGKVMKRTATWAWEEPEWKVVVRKEGATSTTRVERPLPSLVEEGASTGAGRILRVAGKIRGASVDLSPERKMKDLDTGKESGNGKERERSDGEKGADDGQGHVQGQDEEDEESYTDPDGWVYGDNKWEGGSAKGGMGKFTRYRRWSRVAVLSETIEWVDDSDIPSEVKLGKHLLGIPLLPLQETMRHQSEPLPITHVSETPLTSPVSTRKATLEPNNLPSSGHGRTASADSTASAPVTDEGSRLRQRLKAVVNGVGH